MGRDLLEVQPLKSPLKVVVVGGGPAGLSAAAAAAERGAGVTLVEKKKVTGGLLNVAKIPPHKEPIRELIDHLVERARLPRVWKYARDTPSVPPMSRRSIRIG